MAEAVGRPVEMSITARIYPAVLSTIGTDLDATQLAGFKNETGCRQQLHTSPYTNRKRWWSTIVTILFRTCRRWHMRSYQRQISHTDTATANRARDPATTLAGIYYRSNGSIRRQGCVVARLALNPFENPRNHHGRVTRPSKSFDLSI